MKKYLFEEKDEKNRTVRSPVSAILVEDIFGWINKDIAFQKTFLKELPKKNTKKYKMIFEENRPINWRIIGMELLKKELEK